jgi:hypothetical protein
MKAVQKALAMTLVATALCADRAVAASPAVRPEPAARSTLVGRLKVSFRRCVAVVRLWEARRDQERPAQAAAPVVQLCRFEAISLSPFQFRLPPPAA